MTAYFALWKLQYASQGLTNPGEHYHTQFITLVKVKVSIVTLNLSHLWKWKWALTRSTYARIPLSQIHRVTLDYDEDNDDNGDNDDGDDDDDDDDNSFQAKGLPTQLMPESHFPRGKSTGWHLRWDKSIFAWWKLSVRDDDNDDDTFRQRSSARSEKGALSSCLFLSDKNPTLLFRFPTPPSISIIVIRFKHLRTIKSISYI